MTVAVLALQGAFLEHEQMLKKLGADYFEIRQKKDLDRPFDALILPGGESTVMRKLLLELDIYDALKEKILSGLPVFGTCAGLILLAEHIADDPTVHFGTLPVTVKRNAYGRQLGSFQCTADVEEIGRQLPLTFIRAPYIEKAEDTVKVLTSVDGNIVAVRYENQLGLSFHPEVTEDNRVHAYFMEMCDAGVPFTARTAGMEELIMTDK